MGIFGHSTEIQERLTEQWFNQTLYVSSFTNMHSVFYEFTCWQKRYYIDTNELFVNLEYTW